MELCEHSGTPSEIRDPRDLRKVIAGRWLRCGPTMWGVEHAGIEFAADGTYRLLSRKAGKLVPGSGLDAQGTWDLFGTHYPFQLNVTRDGTHVSHPRLTKDPVKMRLVGTGLVTYDFVRLDPVEAPLEWSPPGSSPSVGGARPTLPLPLPALAKAPQIAEPPGTGRIEIAPARPPKGGPLRVAPAPRAPTSIVTSGEPCSLGAEADASFDPGPDIVVARLRYANHRMTRTSLPAQYVFSVGLDISEVLAGDAPRGSLRTTYRVTATEMPTPPVGQRVLVELRKHYEEIFVTAFYDLALAGEVLTRRTQNIAAQQKEHNACDRLRHELASATGSAVVTSHNVKYQTVSYETATRAERRGFRVLATSSDLVPVGSEPVWTSIRPVQTPATRCFLLVYDQIGSEYVVRSVWRSTRDVLAFASRYAKYKGSTRCPS